MTTHPNHDKIKVQKDKWRLPMKLDTLKDQRFATLSQLIKYLQANFGNSFKFDQETTHFFIIDKTNPNRKTSHEFRVYHTNTLDFALEEVK